MRFLGGSAATARDPDAIPTGRFQRAAATSAVLGPRSMRFLASSITSIARSPGRPEGPQGGSLVSHADEGMQRRCAEFADRTREVLGHARGGVMKVGQVASFIDAQFLPPELRAIYQQRLAALRDGAPPMSWARVRCVIESELGARVESLFEEFDHDAAAAASIGQVHRAVLPGGRVGAGKVQYPDIEHALDADVQTAASLIPLSKPLLPGLDAQPLVRELRERVLEELDYELEARHQRLFADAYRGHPFIHVPDVVDGLSRRRVLVTDWVDGLGFEEMCALPQAERDRVGEIIERFYYVPIYRLGRFNTDPHPGNYLLRPDGRVAFVDFGSVRAIDPRQVRELVSSIEAALDGDARRLARRFAAMGFLDWPDEIDADALLERTLASGDWYLRDRELRMDPDYVARCVAALLDPRSVRGGLELARHTNLPPHHLWLLRVELGVLSVLGHLRARGNWHRVARELWFSEESETELGRAEQAFFRGPAGSARPARSAPRRAASPARTPAAATA
jgi:hypothetical protein